MAKARFNPPQLPRQDVILELSADEADVLIILAGSCSGDCCKSRRRIADDIYKALYNLGVTCPNWDERDHHGAIEFKNR